MAGKLAALMNELDQRDPNRTEYRQLDNDRARYEALLGADDPTSISELRSLAIKLGRDASGVADDQASIQLRGSGSSGLYAPTAQTAMQKIGLGLRQQVAGPGGHAGLPANWQQLPAHEKIRLGLAARAGAVA